MIKLEDLHKYIGEKVYVIEPFLEFENGGIDYTLFKPKEATIEEIQMVKNIVGILNVEITLKYPSGIIGTTNEYGVSATYEEAEEECVKTLCDDIRKTEEKLKCLKERKQEIENEKHIDKH